MIDNNKFEDLSRLFKLCIMVPTGLRCLTSALRDSIVRRGKHVNEASSDLVGDTEAHAQETESKKDKRKGKARPPPANNQAALRWMQDVLDLKEKFDKIWKTSLQSSRELESSMNNVRRLSQPVVAGLTDYQGFQFIYQHEPQVFGVHLVVYR